MSPESAATVRRVGEGAPMAQVLRTRAQAEAYVASVCFKHGPPRLLGVELEWLLVGPAGARLDRPALAAALGSHAPTSLDPDSPGLPLPAGSLITVEPGGQLEIASPALPRLDALFEAVEADRAEVHRRLAGQGLRPRAGAADPDHPPRRLLSTARYVAMETAFDRFGAAGREMMCSTAAVQPCLDIGERDGLWRRWTVLHAVGPVLLGAFANSPVLNGRRTGWRSSRMGAWWAIDPARTAPPPLTADDPAAGYARRALNADVLFVPRDGAPWATPFGMSFADWVAGALPDPPTGADLELHLSTLFPPVRPHGRYLEVRYVDAQPGPEWVVPVAVLAALLAEPATTAAALEACLPVAGRWTAAARSGLDDPELAAAARQVFDLARAALPRLVGPGPVRDLVDRVADRVGRGRCTADETDHGRRVGQPGAAR